MVQEAMTYIDQVTDTETKVELIKTLSTVTAGKVGSPEYRRACHTPGFGNRA